MRVASVLVVWLVLAGTCLSCGGARGPITEGANVTNDGRAYSTTAIAVDPTDGRHIAVGAVRWGAFATGALEYGVVAYTSSDWGRTWVEASLPSVDGQGNSDFPSLLYSPRGVLYVSHSVTIAGEAGSRLAVHKSTDNGETWSTPTIIETLVSELPTLTIDEAGDVYVVATGRAADPLLQIEEPESTNAVTISKSTDGGASFSTTGVSFDVDEGIGPMTLAVFDDGAMWLPFVQFIMSERVDESYIYGLRSFDKRESMEGAIPIVVLPRRTPYISNNAQGMNGEGGERLYLTYLEGVQDSLRTAVRFSDDRGRTWSEPRLLEAQSEGHYSRLPRIAVSANGVVGVSWLQSQRGGGECWNGYFAYSDDGGEAFSEPVVLSQQASCPGNASSLAIGEGLLSRATPYGGHYMGLGATESGFQAAWVDLSSGGFQVHTRHVAVPG